MDREVSKDLTWSAEAFARLVWPELSKLYPGRLVQIEAVADRGFARDLDILAGIDAMHIEDGKGIRGIASRMQECPPPSKPYNTFTIRRSRDSGAVTEYEKRRCAIEQGDGLLYPHLTVQGYVTSKAHDSQLLSFAIAKTKDVIDSISRWIGAGRPARSNVWTNRTSNASFFVVRWTEQICTHIFQPTRWAEPTASHRPEQMAFWSSPIPDEPPPDTWGW